MGGEGKARGGWRGGGWWAGGGGRGGGQVVAEEGRPRGGVGGRGRVIIAGGRRGDGRRVVDMGVGVRVRVRVGEGVLVRMSGEEEGRRVGGRMGRRGGHGRAVHVEARVLLLPLGAPVLEPDLHLGLGQREREGQVEPLAHRQVSRRLELVLEGDQLLVSERRPGPPRLPACPTTAPPGPVLAALVLTLATLRLDAARRGGGGGGLPLLAVGRGHVARRGRAPVPARARGLLIGHPHLHVLVLLLLVRLLVHLLHPRLGRALLVLLAAPAGELAPRVTI